jgi:nucleotide-binding universal stress UspA family protein
MPGKVVCGLEDLAGDVRTLSVARGLSERLALQLVAVHVTEARSDPAEEASLTRMVEQAVDAYALQPASVRLERGDPVERLVAAAVEGNAELLVVGSRGRGRVGSALLGSVSTGVVAAAPCPVIVASRVAGERGPRRGDQPEAARSVVCGIDGSEESYAGAVLAADLVARLELRLVLTHVLPGARGGVPVDHPSVLAAEQRARSELLHRAIAAVAHRIRSEVRLERGDPAERLDDLAARESAELIVVGSRGRGARRSPPLGSVATRLAAASHAPVAVLSPQVRLAAGSGEYELTEIVL